MSLVLLTPEALLYCQSAPHLDLLRQAGFEVRYPKNPHLAGGACSDAETTAELQGASAVIAGGERYSEAVCGPCRNCGPDEAIVNRELRDSWRWSTA